VTSTRGGEASRGLLAKARSELAAAAAVQASEKAWGADAQIVTVLEGARGCIRSGSDLNRHRHRMWLETKLGRPIRDGLTQTELYGLVLQADQIRRMTEGQD
jgi:hypothetical protein